MNGNYKKPLSIIAGTMLLLAIPAIWPYGYFQILRWAITGAAIYNAHTFYNHGKKEWVLIMVGIAILFNPIAPIFLTKGIWVVFDLIAAGVFFASIKKLN